jgi:hypothetical protein
MNEPHGLRSRSAKISSASGRAIRNALGATIATAIALAALGAIGIIFPAFIGLQGIAICGALGAATGAALRGPGSWLARVVGGGIGGVIGGYFAVAAGEQFLPGTMQWAYAAVTYPALFAAPMAALVGGLIGLRSAALRSSAGGVANGTIEHALAPCSQPPK